MDLIDGLRAFVATARTGSFTAAAERLGISNRLSSKYVAALEDRLGQRLLQRTTRQVGLTPAGEALLARAPALLDELDTLLADFSETGEGGFSGPLRISAPVTFGETWVAGLLARFAAPHPGLSVHLRLSDAHRDLAAEGIDLAFRIGTPGPATMRRRPLGRIGSVPVAAPAYLERHPAPAHPADLAEHACILDSNRAAPARWTFHRRAGAEDDMPAPDAAESRVEVTVAGRFTVNSARAARDLAEAGHGIAYCPRFVLSEAIEAGRLLPLLPDYESEAYPLNIVYLDPRSQPARLRALIDFAVAEARRSGFA